MACVDDLWAGGWGTGVTMRHFLPSYASNPDVAQQYAKLERLAFSPGALKMAARYNIEIDVRAVLLKLNQPLHHGDRFLGILRPVVAMVEPSCVFRGVVILFDRLIENVHPLLGSEARHFASVIQILLHDDVLQPDLVRKMVLFPHPL